MKPQFAVHFKGPSVSFIVQFVDVFDALDSIIRASGAGYKTHMVRIP